MKFIYLIILVLFLLAFCVLAAFVLDIAFDKQARVDCQNLQGLKDSGIRKDLFNPSPETLSACREAGAEIR